MNNIFSTFKKHAEFKQSSLPLLLYHGIKPTMVANLLCQSLFSCFMTKLSFTFLACLGIQSNVTWASGAVEQQQQVSAEEVKVALAVVPGFIIVASSSRICQF